MLDKSTHKIEIVPIKLEPHSGSDNLSIVRIFDGYTVVVNTESWAGVSHAAYVPPDSVLPDGTVIKANRLRGIMSLGMLLPAPDGAKLGDDVAEQLGITHYEPPTACSTGGESERPPSGYRPVYDLDTARKYSYLFNEKESTVVTEKCHGSSGRLSWNTALDRMQCGSKTEWKRPDDKNIWWKALKGSPELENFCKEHPQFTLYGEVCGSVQKGYNYGCKPGEVKFLCFDIFHNIEARWLDTYEYKELAGKHNLPWVPVLSWDAPFNFEELEKLSNGPSLVKGAQHGREGIVLSPAKERSSDVIGRVKLKIVGSEYLSTKNKKKKGKVSNEND